MDKGSISRVTGIGEELINEDIQSRIDEIEAAGYRYEQTETINLSTKQNTVGSLGHFEPDDYDKIKGEDLTVMTFVGDDQQKRYCIIDSDHEVVNLPAQFQCDRNRTGIWAGRFTMQVEKSSSITKTLF